MKITGAPPVMHDVRQKDAVPLTMLCDHCKQQVATVHISGSSTSGADAGGTPKPFEDHYCESCAKQLEQTDARLNPMLAASPGSRKWKFRIMAVSGDRVIVRGVQTENSTPPHEMSFLIARLPKDYAVVGSEFEVICTLAELDRLTQDRDW